MRTAEDDSTVHYDGNKLFDNISEQFTESNQRLH